MHNQPKGVAYSDPSLEYLDQEPQADAEEARQV